MEETQKCVSSDEKTLPAPVSFSVVFPYSLLRVVRYLEIDHERLQIQTPTHPQYMIYQCKVYESIR
jgi:hypothetical protein